MKSKSVMTLAFGLIGLGLGAGVTYVRWQAAARADLVTSVQEAVYREIRRDTPLSATRHADIVVDHLVVGARTADGIDFEATVTIERVSSPATFNPSGIVLVPQGKYQFKAIGTADNTPIPIVDALPLVTRQTLICRVVSMERPPERLVLGNRADKIWERSRGHEDDEVFDAWVQLALLEDDIATHTEPVIGLLYARKHRLAGRFTEAQALLATFPVDPFAEDQGWFECYGRERELTAAKDRTHE